MQIIAAADKQVAVDFLSIPLNRDQSRRSPFCREMTSISRDTSELYYPGQKKSHPCDVSCDIKESSV